MSAQKKAAIAPLLGITILISVAAAAYLLNKSPQAETPPTPPVSEAAVLDPAAKPVNTSTTVAPTTTTADSKSTESLELPSEEPRNLPETFSTPDPNDEPDNTLAGISYRDVEMWEIPGLGLPEKLKGGVMISKIHAKSSFAESQIQAGDIITHAHHSKVVNFDDLSNAVKDRSHSLLDVYRDGKAFQVVLNRPYRP
ncbi:MAG: PDZ domain-containing protein [Myxococcota bacterium]|nr:PDZ domain-containing protein [Myxococcota bacterium]